jgi:hypothetical protein
VHYAKSVIATLEGLAFFTHFGIAVRVVSLPLVIQHAPSYAYGSVPVCINGAILATSPFHVPLDQSQFVRMDIIDLFRLVLRPGALTWGSRPGILKAADERKSVARQHPARPVVQVHIAIAIRQLQTFCEELPAGPQAPSASILNGTNSTWVADTAHRRLYWNCPGSSAGGLYAR